MRAAPPPHRAGAATPAAPPRRFGARRSVCAGLRSLRSPLRVPGSAPRLPPSLLPRAVAGRGPRGCGASSPRGPWARPALGAACRGSPGGPSPARCSAPGLGSPPGSPGRLRRSAPPAALLQSPGLRPRRCGRGPPGGGACPSWAGPRARGLRGCGRSGRGNGRGTSAALAPPGACCSREKKARFHHRAIEQNLFYFVQCR